MSEQSKIDSERAAFEAWVTREWPTAPLHYVRDALPKDDPRYGEYCDESLQRAWVGWQARTSLPVGVPDVPDVLFDGFAVLSALSDKAKSRTSSENVSDVLDAVVNLIRDENAPTVKAEQVQCELPVDAANIRHLERCNIDGCWRCENLMYFYQACDECGAWGHNDAGACACLNKAPSLPAAGSVVDRVVATAPERIYLIIGDGCPRDADFSELGDVAWCEEEAEQGIEYVRAALSAQQSAPERVSVPKLAGLKSVNHQLGIVALSFKSSEQAQEAVRELRALLASHGRGEA